MLQISVRMDLGTITMKGTQYSPGLEIYYQKVLYHILYVGILHVYRDAIGGFYSPSQLGFRMLDFLSKNSKILS